jgi:hypothetical protein
MMLQAHQQRAYAALQQLTQLHTEKQVLYTKLSQQSWRVTQAEKKRLYDLIREIALVQDERNRARCGAPPAPPDYDPIAEPPVFPEAEEGNENGERGHRKTTEVEVSEMRRLHTVEGMTATQVWHEYNHLKESTIRDILKNRTWYDPNYTPPVREKPSKPLKPSLTIRDVVNQRTQVCERMAG